MSTRRIANVFDDYQKARTEFVQTVADLASRPENAVLLSGADVMPLLRPLLLDKVESIQHLAALAIGRLANSSSDLAEAIIGGDILPHVVYSMQKQNKLYQKSATLVLRAVAKHSPELAQSVIDAGGLEGLISCVESFDAPVKESAVWAIGIIARHREDLAMAVVDSGAVPVLTLCLNEQSLAVRRTAACTLAEICRHTPTLAQMVVNAGAIQSLSAAANSKDAKLKRHALSALGHIAKHNVDLAELVVEGDILPSVLQDLKNPDEQVRRNVASLIREIVRHTPDLAQLVANAGAIAGLVDFIADNSPVLQVPAVLSLGFMSSMSETLAAAVIKAGAVVQMNAILRNPTNDAHELVSATVWAIGQTGRHSPDHTKAVAEGDCLLRMVRVLNNKDWGDVILKKTETALKLVLCKCTRMEALQQLLSEAPPHILEHVVAQFSKVLPHDGAARRLFITSGALKKINAIVCDSGSTTEKAIRDIQGCFPTDIVKYYSPGYSDTILERVQNFKPALNNV